MRTRIIASCMIICALQLYTGCTRVSPVIRISDSASQLETLAAKEIRRYLYLTTGELLEIRNSDAGTQQTIILKVDDQLDTQQYRLKTLDNQLVISGGSDHGLLYGAYELAEQFGVRFYLHGDVIPDEKVAFKIPVLDIDETPLFNLRGIQPFHDFPEGPDWWNEYDYKAVIAQLLKMKMNFIGFHTYPENKDWNGNGYRPAEPLVWIGKEPDVDQHGNVKIAYPTAHFYTNDSTWGYGVARTSEFSMGAGQIFESDIFGADYMKGMPPWPRSEEENIRIFNQAGKMFGEVFGFAETLGINTCIGTETPLVIPDDIKTEYRIHNETDDEIRELYRGMFGRISKIYPIDYYWLWTPEYWTWSPVSDQEVMRTEMDMLLAYEVLEDMGKPFRLATCGWVLGPPEDRSQFDNSLPKDVPFSCINRGVGYSPVEISFKDVSGRPKWSIPWLEDDPDMISAQLWAGRMRKDALDSWLYGCDGLLGIHWRTRMVGPNISALAKAAWTADEWAGMQVEGVRDLQVDDFYTDWVKTQFGLDDQALVDLFISLDSKGYEAKEGHKGDAPLNASQWIAGPGSLMMNAGISDIKEHISRYGFIGELESYRCRITGKGNMERFNYWLQSFMFNEAILQTALTRKELDLVMEEIAAEPDMAKKGELAGEKALALRMEMVKKWAEMTRILLSKITTNGELGTLANLELHNLRKLDYLYGHDPYLEELGIALPPDAYLPSMYDGPTRIITTGCPSVLLEGEDLYLRVRVLSSAREIHGELMWRRLGSGKFSAVQLERVNRNVFQAGIPADEIKGDFEYFISVDAAGEEIMYPVTARNINNTAVILK